MSFWSEYLPIILFYSIIIGLIWYFRKKFEFQGKIVALYRTKIGVSLMERWGKGGAKFIRVLATIGMWVGFAGILFMVYMLADGLYNFIFVPEAPATLAPILPGVRIPGVEVFVPFWYGIIALFVTIVIHEFSHGLVAAAYNLKVKHSGFVMFGPLPGAFVEPDEKQLLKAPRKAQLSVFAAGPFSNILLTILLIILFGFLPTFANAMGGSSEGLETFTKYTSIVNTAKIQDELYRPTGLRLSSVVTGSAAEEAGMENGTLVTTINGNDIIENQEGFEAEIAALYNLTPGQVVVMENANESWTIIARPRADDPARGQMGILFSNYLEAEKDPAALEKYGKTGFVLINVFIQQIFWIILLSSGIGLANLLPLGPVDGGRMLLLSLEKWLPKKKAMAVWSKITVGVVIVVLLLVLGPIVRHLLASWFS
jgi:membrane-associated protease RseP (regulator of RpoE activity)